MYVATKHVASSDHYEKVVNKAGIIGHLKLKATKEHDLHIVL